MKNKHFARMIIYSTFSFFLIISLFLTSCTKSSSNHHFIVVASLPVLASIANEIFADIPVVEIYSILNPNENPHTYELLPQDMLMIKKADLILMVGQIDSWLEKADLNENRTLIFQNFAVPISGNPHYWFDLIASKDFARAMVRFANNSEILKPYMKQIQRNYESFATKIDAILQGNSDLSYRSVVSVLPTFDYLFRSLNIKTHDTLLNVPNAELKANDIALFVDTIINTRVTCIVSNAFFPSKLKQTLQYELSRNGVNARIVDLLPMPRDRNQYYTNFIDNNVKLLRECLS